MTEMMKTEATPGTARGRMIRQNSEKREQPSIIAASSSALGIVSIDPFRAPLKDDGGLRARRPDEDRIRPGALSFRVRQAEPSARPSPC